LQQQGQHQQPHQVPQIVQHDSDIAEAQNVQAQHAASSIFSNVDAAAADAPLADCAAAFAAANVGTTDPAALANSQEAVNSSSSSALVAEPVEVSNSAPGAETGPEAAALHNATEASAGAVATQLQLPSVAQVSAADSAAAAAAAAVANGMPERATSRQASAHRVVTTSSTTTTVTTVTSSSSCSSINGGDVDGAVCMSSVVSATYEQSSSRSSSSHAVQLVSTVPASAPSAAEAEDGLAAQVDTLAGSRPAAAAAAAANGSFDVLPFDVAAASNAAASLLAPWPDVLPAFGTTGSGTDAANVCTPAEPWAAGDSTIAALQPYASAAAFHSAGPASAAIVGLPTFPGAPQGFAPAPNPAAYAAPAMNPAAFASSSALQTLSLQEASLSAFDTQSSLASISSPNAAAGGGPGGGMLSGFVSLATYQEQMQSVASLHSQVGQLVVQLREAHADADGAQQQLQQERQVRLWCVRCIQYASALFA
jgi:hypothetical protein